MNLEALKKFIEQTAYVDANDVTHDITALDNAGKLALANAHEKIEYDYISPAWAGQYFGLMGVLKNIEAGVTDTTVVQVIPGIDTTIGEICKTVLSTISSSKNGFAANPLPLYGDGHLNRIASSKLVEHGYYPESVESSFFRHSETVTLPLADATENDILRIEDTGQIEPLPINNDQHSVAVTVANDLDKPVDVLVQQKLGTDSENTTDWLDVCTIRGVQYSWKIGGYQSGQIPASPAPYRELRIVSAQTIGMSVI